MDHYLDLKAARLQDLNKYSSNSNKNDSYDLRSGFVAYLWEYNGITPMTIMSVVSNERRNIIAAAVTLDLLFYSYTLNAASAQLGV